MARAQSVFFYFFYGWFFDGLHSPSNGRIDSDLLKTEDASREQLMNEVNRFATVNSIDAKMYLKFEDNSFAEFGSKEVYRSADGDVVVQRPVEDLHAGPGPGDKDGCRSDDLGWRDISRGDPAGRR